MPSHLDDNTLHLFAAGQLDDKHVAQIESHLALCPQCLERLHRIETKQPNRLFQAIKSAQFATSIQSEGGVNTVTESMDFLPGDRIGGNYRLENQVGRGGMGVAWKAWDETAERSVVLKFVRLKKQHAVETMASVRESFQKVHALQHQNICPLYGLFDDPKHGLFLVMKFVEGLTLNEFRQEHIGQHGQASLENTVQLLMPIADALDYAHRQKVIHRDIKPQNVIVSPKDGVQIIDFGLADNIHESHADNENAGIKRITGTRFYMAPEQWEGKKQDAQTDQYALAVTAYELLAGHVPFSGTDTENLKHAVLHAGPAKIPGLPKHVNAALRKGLAKNGKDRFPSCVDFVTALEKPTRSVVRKSLFPAIRIGLALLIAAMIYLGIQAFMKPLTDPELPLLQGFFGSPVNQFVPRQLHVPAKQPRKIYENNASPLKQKERREHQSIRIEPNPPPYSSVYSHGSRTVVTEIPETTPSDQENSP
jgi:serine/threonine-protein kinase